MSSLHLSMSGLDALLRGLAQAPDATRRELLAAMAEATQLVEREAKERTPRVTGMTAASIASDAFSTPVGVIGTVGSSQPSLAFVELGTRPHPVSAAGREALAAWAVKRLGVSKKEAPRVAFLIARKIARKGTKAQRPLGEAIVATESQVLHMFEDAAARVAAHLAAGAA